MGLDATRQKYFVGFALSVNGHVAGTFNMHVEAYLSSLKIVFRRPYKQGSEHQCVL